MLDAVRLEEKSYTAVALASWHDRLYLAWTGSDLHLNLAWSPDGRMITDKQRLEQRSYRTETTSTGQSSTTQNVPLTPGLGVVGESVYLAWTGGNGALNLLAMLEYGSAEPVTLKERSAHGPSLATASNGSLMLAWTGTDRHLNLLDLAADSAGPPPPAGAKTRLEQARSDHSPALCSYQGGLVLAWRGSDRHINILPGAQSPYGTPVRLEEARSGSGPALCSHQGDLILAWTGSDRRINILAGAQSPYGRPARLDEARSGSGPALCSHQGDLIVAWPGTDHHLNVARLR